MQDDRTCDDTLNAAQEAEVRALLGAFPYRIVYTAERDGEWFASAVTSMRIPNKLAREGYRVNLIKKG